jgi:hypothetical protein
MQRATQTLLLLQETDGLKCTSFVKYQRKEVPFAGFSGFIEYMSRCSNGTGSSANCDCDLGVGAWAISSTRYEKADLVAGFSNDEFQTITRVDKARGQKLNRFFFFTTFTWPVWLAVAGIFLFHILVTMLDPKFFPRKAVGVASTYKTGSWAQRLKALLLKSDDLFRLRQSFFSSAYHLLGQAPHFYSGTKKGTKEKTLGMIALFMGVFLLTVYQASITVQVILSSPSPEFVSVRDFESCRISADRVVLLANGAAQSFWEKAVARTRYLLSQLLRSSR